jgi:hypothetical protein
MEKEYYKMVREHTTNKEIHLIINRNFFITCTTSEISKSIQNFILEHVGYNAIHTHEWVYNNCRPNTFYQRIQDGIKEHSPEWSFEATLDKDNLEITLRKHKPEVTIKRTVTIDT